MGFDADKFTKTSFKDRTTEVPVPRLRSFFSKDEKAVWVVRGLTGEESAIAKQEVANNRNTDAILQAIGSTSKSELVEGVKELANLNKEKVPDELVQRFVWLESGSVDPDCSHDLAVKLATNFPEDFYLLTNKIMELTGQGRVGE